MTTLNIGSGQWVEQEMLNIDNGSDYGNPEIMVAYARNYMEFDLKRECVFMLMDGNLLAFKDEVFDKVYSSSCVGYYVDNYAEITRVLKHGGTIELYVWAEHVPKVIAEMSKYGVCWNKIEWKEDYWPEDESMDIRLMKMVGKKERY